MTDAQSRLSAALSDRYRIERELGAGGMATVYLAHDIKHNRQVAIKVLRPELAAALGADRFLREIETTASLRHPHILPLFDSGAVPVSHPERSEGSLLYFVMPYIEGESLRSRLIREAQLPIDVVVQIIREVADALGYAHTRGVVHRDIKPENILLERGHAVVGDFGIAKALAEGQRPERPKDAKDPANPGGPPALTTLGVSIGTPAYMAPEQVAGDPHIDHRADLYALGLVAYEMLAGGSPYTATTPAQQMAAHVAQPPAPVELKRKDCPPALAALVMRCLAKNPDERWQSADDLVDQLRRLDTVPPRRAVAFSGRRTATIVALALLAITTVVAIRRRTPPTPGATSANVIAVLPFTVRGGPQVAWLGEGIVDLLSTSLDGAAGLRSVNAHALLGYAGQDASAMSIERASTIADHFKAGLFVVGDVLEVNGKLRLSASLFDRSDRTRPLAEAAVDGEPGEVLSLVDLLATRLAADRSAEGGARLTRTAAVTTSSIPALQAYMSGEQAYRAGQYSAATKAFHEAVTADTGFALAFHRLGMAQERMAWADEAGRSAELAYRHSSRLSAHDRRFLEALLATRRGHSSEAEQQFRAIAQSWPDDAEAWYQLGELGFHGNPLRGQSFTDSRTAFSQALFLDPGDLGALYHLMRIAARDGDQPALDSLSRRFYRLSPGGDRTLELRALQALAVGDSVAADSAMAALGRAPDGVLAIAMWSIAVFAQSLPDAARLARFMTEPARPRDVRAQGHVLLSYLELAQGRLGQARSELAAATVLHSSEAPLIEAWFSTLPWIPATRAEIDAARTRLAAWDATDTTWLSSQPSAFYSGHNGVRSILKACVLGLLDIRRGATAEAMVGAAQLQRMGSATDGPPLALELAEGLRAQLALAKGQPDSALATLEALQLEGWYELTFMSAFYGGALERFTRARLLRERGRNEEALRWYGGLSENSTPELVFLGPATLAQARIQKALGRPKEAALLYEAFLELWQDSDPVFKPMLDSARTERVHLISTDP